MRTIHTSFHALIALAFCGAAVAQTARVSLDIEPQPVRLALKDLGEQTGLQIMFRAEDVAQDEMATPRISGELSAREALERILSNTGLQYRFVNPNTVLISAKDGVEKTAVVSEAGVLRMAQREMEGSGADPQSMGNGSGAEASQEESREEGGGKLEEIVVTAQRREENLQDVPIAITVLGGQELDRSTVSGATEALRLVPGFDSELNQYSAGGASFSVRGVSNSTARGGGAGPIAYYIDGVPFGFVRSAFYPDPSVYDLRQIEFLSGPQGTLYGAGSLNGVLRILTNNANADELELKARASVSTTEHGGQNEGADLAVNVPIVEGILGARAVAGFQNDSGWIDAPNARDVNDEETRNYRLKLHVQPTETLSIDLSAWRSESDIGAPALANASRRITSTRAQPGSQRFDAFGIDINKQFDTFAFSSMTSHIDFNSASLVDGTPAFSLSSLDTRYEANVLSQEFNLISDEEGPWRWSAGAFYRQAEDRTYQFVDRYNPASVDSINNDFTDESESYAVYGEIGRDLAEELSLAVGVRYFHDEEEMYLNQQYPTAPASLLPVRAPFSATSEAWTPRSVLTWTPSAHHTVYASYSQGFRSGFAQQPNVQALYPNFTPVDPDKLVNYEIGTKGSALNGRLTYETAVFYIDWQDVQQNLRVQLATGLNTTATINGEGASGIGASFSVVARPFGGFELGANASWNDLTFDNDIVQTNANGTTSTLFRKGDRLNQSPEYTIGALAGYSWNLSGGYMSRIGVNGTYKAPQITTTLISGSAESDTILIAGATVSIEAPENWALTLFADNITDEDGATTYFTTVPEWATRQRPRTMGLQLTYNFGQ